MEKRTIRQWIHFTLTAVTSLYVITGIGISGHRLMESLSLGLLTKGRSLWIHGNLLQLFTALLFLHIYFKVRPILQRNASAQNK